MAIRLAILLVLAGVGLVAAAEGTRDGVFVGYKEAGVEGAADAAADSVDNLNVADGSGDGSLQAAADQEGTSGDVQAGKEADTVPGSGGDGAAGSQDAAAAADLTAVAGAVGRSVVLHTQFGPIKVKLLEQLAPRTTALVWDLAEKRGCRNCAFYRNEARPRLGSGPPYALLQGRLDVPEVPPREGAIEVKMGHVCFIPDTKDFFIAYGDHPEWGTGHTVWGLVDEWFATDFITAQQYREVTHPEFGTVMRMLKEEVPLKVATDADAFYSGKLGPMHYDEPPL
ncbi:hypothetical protein D9Q98_008839 [Chlorella vulgaris]|uniref:Peptidylprolyl isomerase n=1 Tax=Chlorella vulgaris TaxID=3077 RepID=A0A9D4TIT2_CHLVU|nr:hypothetical protein D9Q98_008839 [Chlorella vulgaris]